MISSVYNVCNFSLIWSGNLKIFVCLLCVRCEYCQRESGVWLILHRSNDYFLRKFSEEMKQ